MVPLLSRDINYVDKGNRKREASESDKNTKKMKSQSKKNAKSIKNNMKEINTTKLNIGFNCYQCGQCNFETVYKESLDYHKAFAHNIKLLNVVKKQSEEEIEIKSKYGTVENQTREIMTGKSNQAVVEIEIEVDAANDFNSESKKSDLEIGSFTGKEDWRENFRSVKNINQTHNFVGKTLDTPANKEQENDALGNGEEGDDPNESSVFQEIAADKNGRQVCSVWGKSFRNNFALKDHKGTYTGVADSEKKTGLTKPLHCKLQAAMSVEYYSFGDILCNTRQQSAVGRNEC